MFKYVQNRVLVYLRAFWIAVDLLFINICFLFAFDLAVDLHLIHYMDKSSSAFQSLWMMYNLLALLAALITNLYRDSSMERLESMFRATFRGGMGLIISFGICVMSGFQLAHAWPFVAILSFILATYFIVSRFFMTYIYPAFAKKFNWSKRVAIIGHGDHVAPVADYFERQGDFYSINTIGYKDQDAFHNKEKTLKRFKEYFKAVSNQGIHDVFLVTTPDMSAYSEELIVAADFQCVQLNFVPAISARITYNGSVDSQVNFELPVLKSHEEPMSTMENRLKKRLVDLFISSMVIIFILSWMIPIIGLIIKIQSPGPIFFKQPRSGRNNRAFGCYKFRSMVVNKQSGEKQATKNDKRITPIGNFLRKTNLDEFPQFINVFLGQMSVVGPRPHMLSHTEHYSQLIQHYMVRHFVKPGITGWAQVNGYRGETKDPNLMAKRVEYDIEYLRNWSAMLDFKIVCMTAINMAKGEENAY